MLPSLVYLLSEVIDNWLAIIDFRGASDFGDSTSESSENLQVEENCECTDYECNISLTLYGAIDGY